MVQRIYGNTSIKTQYNCKQTTRQLIIYIEEKHVTTQKGNDDESDYSLTRRILLIIFVYTNGKKLRFDNKPLRLPKYPK